MSNEGPKNTKRVPTTFLSGSDPNSGVVVVPSFSFIEELPNKSSVIEEKSSSKALLFSEGSDSSHSNPKVKSDRRTKDSNKVQAKSLTNINKENQTVTKETVEAYKKLEKENKDTPEAINTAGAQNQRNKRFCTLF